MSRRFLALVTLWLFAAMLVVPAAATFATAAHVDASESWHADGSPCPDDDQDGPCDDGCACHCCHGPALALWHPALAHFEQSRLSVSTLRAVGPRENHRSNHYLDRVFRPPRA